MVFAVQFRHVKLEMLSCRQFVSKCSVHFDWNTFFCNNHPALITQMICYQIAPFSAPTTTAINWGSKLLHLPLRHAELILDCIQFRKERIASVLFGAHVYIPSITPSYKLYQTWVGYESQSPRIVQARVRLATDTLPQTPYRAGALCTGYAFFFNLSRLYGD